LCNGLSERRGVDQVVLLAAKSPYLNPDEQVWTHVTREISRKFVTDKADMKRIAIGTLRRSRSPPVWLQQSASSCAMSHFIDPAIKHG